MQRATMMQHGYHAIMQILVASSNPHKVNEIKAVLTPLGIDAHGLDSLSQLPPEPVEDGDTFEANARIKAMAYALATEQPCLADDSGLEVDALGGQPGVYSARYAEREGIAQPSNADRTERDHANNKLLLERVRDVPHEQRTARFVCAMCLADATGQILAETRGTFDGIIIDEPRGNNGFGYDPLLLIPELGKTSAELPPSEKNERSHRGQAVREMAMRIPQQLSG